MSGASEGGRGTSGLAYGHSREGSTSRGGTKSWLPLREVPVVLEELLAFGCCGDKVLVLLPRGELRNDLLSTSSLL